MAASTRIIRFAVVGLGHIAQVAVIPAFAHARRNSELVAMVSGDRAKRREIAKRYRLAGRFAYDEYDECLDSSMPWTLRCRTRCMLNTPSGRLEPACMCFAKSRWPSPSTSVGK